MGAGRADSRVKSETSREGRREIAAGNTLLDAFEKAMPWGFRESGKAILK